MTRRQILVAGVGVAAASAGIGWALRERANRSAGGPLTSAPAHPDAFWNLRFETPDGGEVALVMLRGRPLLLNFWATWCPPCVEEMPMLDRFQKSNRGNGWQVLGLAIDGAQPVREFLAGHPVGFTIGLAAVQGVALSRSLGNTQGALPFSVIFDSRGEAVMRKLGALKWDDLTAWERQIR